MRRQIKTTSIETKNYKITTTSLAKSVTAISEFYTNTQVSNFSHNFISVVTFEYSNTPSTKKGALALEKFLTSTEWPTGVNIKLSNNNYLIGSSVYLIQLKETEETITKNSMYCYILESVFFNMRNTDINNIINQYVVDFGHSVSASLLTNLKIPLEDSDILTIRQLGAEFLGISDKESFPAISCIAIKEN